jgi:predicted unusual protein kinase regulating ubiquinone biosynthesis (AarF/ABC1/UbiB family)
VEKGAFLHWWSLQEFVEEFADIMDMQLDLRKEAVRRDERNGS